MRGEICRVSKGGGGFVYLGGALSVLASRPRPRHVLFIVCWCVPAVIPGIDNLFCLKSEVGKNFAKLLLCACTSNYVQSGGNAGRVPTLVCLESIRYSFHNPFGYVSQVCL